MLLCHQHHFLLQMQEDNNNSPPWLQFPLLVCAPMVEQSELPFRLLTRRHGTTLAYTPMLHSKMMTTVKNYKNEHFTTCPQDRPLVAQFCGNDPQTIVKAAKMVENEVDAVDINLGCPQGIARKGHYGSFLLEEPQLIEKMVVALVANLKVPVFCKIRVLKSEEKTIALAQRLEKAGCSLLTVHGRVKEQNKDKVGQCDWNIIKKIKAILTIPVVANGGIYLYSDVERCLTFTGVDGVMSSEALLQNPALFSGKIKDLDLLALQYLDLAKQYPGANDSCIRAHLFKLLFTGLSKHTDLREKLVKAMGLDQFRWIVLEMLNRRKEMPAEQKLGWYLRYWKEHPPAYYLKGISCEQVKSELKEEKQKPQQQQMMEFGGEPSLVQGKEEQIITE